MKKLFGIAIAMAALIILVGCEGEVTLDTPSVTYEVGDNGGSLTLTWVEITDADGYYIYADDAVVDTLDDPTTTTYTTSTPAQVYGVTAYAGSDESTADEVDCTPVETMNITVYGNSDPAPDHPSGIGFTTSGNCVTLALSDSTNWIDIDFYFDDANFTFITIVSPSDHLPNPYNDEENFTSDSGTDYDGLDIADPSGTYISQRTLAEGAVLSLWIDPDHDGWDDENDHFGKMSIESISGSAAPYSAVITVAYQPVAGLRWVVTQ